MRLNYRKLLIFIVSILIVSTIIFTLIFLIISTSRTTKISSAKLSYSVPNVTEDNTIFEIDNIEDSVENVTITVKQKLKSYELYYYIKTDSSDSENNVQNYLPLNDSITIDENCSIYFKYKSEENFSFDNYEIKISNIIIPEIIEEKISEAELKKETVDKKEVVQSTSPYYIKVNYLANVVTIYTKDAEGNYTVPVKAMVCSCGEGSPHSGVYKTSDKYRWGKLIHNSYGQYSTRIVRSILFHSVPYNSNSSDSLQYEEFDKLGTTASAGCVRLTVIDSKWIYDNCPKGTMVEFYSDSNPGPLGKPSAPKISSNEECRNWDPTDPSEANPWRNRNKQSENSGNDNSNNSGISESVNNTITNNINNTTSENNTSSNNTSNNTNNTSNQSSTNTSNTSNTTNNQTPSNTSETNNYASNNIP